MSSTPQFDPAHEPWGASGWDLLMPFVAFVMLIIALPLTIKWASMPTHPVPGTYTAVDRWCQEGDKQSHTGTDCTWYGTFTSTDGKTTIGNTRIHGGDDRLDEGATVPAMDVGGTVYSSAGPQRWKWVVIEAIFGVSALALWPLLRKTSERRRPDEPRLGPIARRRGTRHMSEEQKWDYAQRRYHKLGKRARR